MQLIDSHAHLDFADFDSDRDQTIKRAQEAAVKKIINVGADLDRSKQSIEIARNHSNIWATAGIHPEGCRVDLREAKTNLKRLIESSDKVVAIGECGLDYFYEEQNKVEQKALFQLQIDLAIENKLPLVVHIRNGKDESAVADAYNILSVHKEASGVIHCFTLGRDWAIKFVKLGFYTGFTGIVTYKNAEMVRDSVKAVPTDRLLIETDCPYLAPQEYRGQRNEPAYVLEVAKKVSELKKVKLSDLAAITSKNAERLFHI